MCLLTDQEVWLDQGSGPQVNAFRGQALDRSSSLYWCFGIMYFNSFAVSLETLLRFRLPAVCSSRVYMYARCDYQIPQLTALT